MARRPHASVFIILLGMLVLSRHITGVPGAQVEIFRTLVSNKAVEKLVDNSKIPLIDPSHQDCGSHTISINQQTNFENKSSYKKYVSPDKNVNYKQIPQLAENNYHSTSFTQFWLFSTLPQVIHANDPPHFTSPQIHSFISPLTIGDRDYLYETKSCTDNRGVCINCIRP
mgnify:CR=1 FL=1